MAKQSSETLSQLDVLERQANELSSSRKIQTEEARHLINLIVRLIEVQRYGTTKTPQINSHNA